ncbi:DUF1491 family protein [Sphingomonas ginkgonis]|uniref:DUF1491 family protein n=1 Tax=Sphingomonas ginkgonis TaxID=2315330 RepID=A0A3R9Y443_9SPHN|nr:DUF1491 family protein [Sphingomonas ginkgonis]RST29763.1 DUF1491 family protein [Sphingomonas ginkgonis]
MSDDRLAAHLEVAGLLRRAEALGGTGTIVARGDRERGGLLIQVTERGTTTAVLERLLGADGRYRWQRSGPKDASESAVDGWMTSRRRNDPDLWLIELAIVPSARFIDETTGVP